MKTIQELNSKWYWRLIKVIYGIILSIILIAGTLGFLFEYMGYNPSNINKVQNELNEIKKFYENLSNFNISIQNEFQGILISKSELLTKSGIVFSGAISKVGRLGTIKGLGYNIEGVLIGSENDPEIAFDDWSKNKLSELYVEDLGYLKSLIKDGKTFIADTEAIIKEAKTGQYVYFSNTLFRNDFNSLIGEKSYIGLWLIFKTIGVFILIIIGLSSLTFIIRGITYYIILGKFNPEK